MAVEVNAKTKHSRLNRQTEGWQIQKDESEDKQMTIHAGLVNSKWS